MYEIETFFRFHSSEIGSSRSDKKNSAATFGIWRTATAGGAKEDTTAQLEENIYRAERTLF